MSNVDMAEAVRMLAADKGISVDTLLQVLADALVAAYKRRQDAADEAEAQIDVDTMDIRIIAYDIDEDGNWVNPHDDTPEDMGRIAAQTFRQVLNQRIREAERDKKFEEYANREGDIVTGIIQQTDSRYTLLGLGLFQDRLNGTAGDTEGQYMKGVGVDDGPHFRKMAVDGQVRFALPGAAGV